MDVRSVCGGCENVRETDPSSPTTASSDSTHKPCDQCGLKVSTALGAEHQCKHNWVTLAAYDGC